MPIPGEVQNALSKMYKDETFTELNLLNGDTITIKIPIGRNISKAGNACSVYNTMYKDNPVDIVPFLLQEVTLVNGERESVDYFLGLMIDDYMAIMNTVGVLFQPITGTKK